MKRWSNIWLFLLISLILSCNKDPVQKGDEAFESDQLLEAQKYYQQALEQNPADSRIREKLILTFFKTGENFYQTRRLVTSFEGQVKQGFAYLPDPLTDSLRKEISRTLLKLARAFREGPARNEYQKKEFAEKSIFYLNTALEYDSTNTEVLEELQRITSEEIDGLMQKGMAYYQAGKQRPENYFTAEQYFKDVLALDADNREALKNLKSVRTELLTVYDYEQFTPLKITGRSTIGKLLVYEITIMNNTNRTMELKGDGFYLVASDGSRSGGFFSEEFSMPYLTKKLPSRKEATGVVSFEPQPGKRYVRLEYKGGDRFEGYKNLP